MFKIRNFSEGDAMLLAQISNEALGDEIARGMPSFISERLLYFSRRLGVKVFVAESEINMVGFLTLTD
ncbi:MAG: hypothetical protein AOA65_0754 [Candidatus Bathyarchaeota archaeon BA1]|nr:MAG: hypothetical protein AOA65_0754 [Candidatus Bathyarchaeota archaeon BA1]